MFIQAAANPTTTTPFPFPFPFPTARHHLNPSLLLLAIGNFRRLIFESLNSLFVCLSAGWEESSTCFPPGKAVVSMNWRKLTGGNEFMATEYRP